MHHESNHTSAQLVKDQLQNRVDEGQLIQLHPSPSPSPSPSQEGQMY